MGQPADVVTLEAIEKANAAIDAANPVKVAAAAPKIDPHTDVVLVADTPAEPVNTEKKEG